MKGALRVMWLIFAAFPIQRWLCAIGLLFIVAAFLIPGAAPLAILGLVLPVLPTLFGSGVILRVLLSPRTMRLIPRGRERVLAAMVLATLTISSLSTVVLWSLGLLHGSALVFWIRVEAVASLVLVTQFVSARRNFGPFIWMIVLCIALPLLPRTTLAAVVKFFAARDGLLAAIAAAVWVGFGIWFLGVREFQNPNLIAARRGHLFKLRISSDIARRTFLLGAPSTDRRVIVSGAIGALALTVAWWLLLLITGTHASFAERVSDSLPFVLGLSAYGGMFGLRVTRRSRFLWLRTGLDRVGVFKACEAQAWRSYIAATISFSLLLPVAWAVSPSLPLLPLALSLTFHLALGTCLLYLGLMNVRGWTALDVILAIVLVGAWMTVTLLSVPAAKLGTTPPLMPIWIGAAALGALAFRQIGLLRWRRIDWLVCKPPTQTEVTSFTG